MKKSCIIVIVVLLIVMGFSMDKNKEAKDVYIKSDKSNIKKEIFTDKELKWIEKYQNKDIYVGIAEDYTPIEYIDKNGNPKGIGIEIIKTLNQLTGLKFKVYKNSQKETWEEILQSTSEKRIDILPAVSFTKERNKYLDYSTAYIEMTQVILGHKDNPKLFNDITQVKGKMFVGPKGYWFLDIVAKQNSDAKIIGVKSMEKALSYISSKKAEYTISDIPVFTYYKEKGDYNDIKIIGELKQKNKIYIGVRKDFGELIPIINKVIKNIDDQELYEKALVMPKNSDREEKLIFMIVLLSTILLWVIYYLYKTFRNLIKAKKEAEEANKDKTQLMTNISHDLRTPITVIIGYTQAIIDGEARKEDKDRYIKRIHERTKYLNDLINDFFLVARLKDRKFILEREDVNINGLIKNIVENIELKAQDKNIQLLLELDEKANMNKKVDRLKFYRAIENIMINAIKYSKEEGFIKIITEGIKDEKIKIAIKDNGMGIHQEELPYIFDRYYKGKNANKESIGLGLYITKEIIDKHDGKIWVESILNKGTVFYILI
ncbi:ATP-binding protein [Crassaminicella profunda]|uniref:ATP-binding protein n=1 Tax=Crassaminicella profunda TaxID=1286698 RepID=UPI001CA5FD16|nr:transporter substrate-binding domain-containing protein [Crassaminicella profunda]QZY54104.1 transporter substrate-binding domain-containing protein [Crassaminicella profunda]